MRSLFGAARAAIETKSTDLSAVSWETLFGQSNSKSGVSVNIDSAIRVTAALACAQAIACGLSGLPFKAYRPVPGGGREEARDLPLFDVVESRPNDWQTSVEFMETMLLHALFTGGGRAYIGRAGAQKEVRELIPLTNVTVRRVDGYGLVYDVNDPEMRARLPASDVLDLRGPSWNGYQGLDVVHTIRDALGLAIATEETHAKLHLNGAQPGGILSVEGSLGDVARERLTQAMQDKFEGLSNRFRTLILDQNAHWLPMGMTGVDAQHLATRQFQIEEICRGFGVFPQIIGHSGDHNPTYASAEQFFLAHVVHTLGRWTRRIEKRYEVSLLTAAQRREGIYFKFSLQALLRADNKTRAEFYTALITLGVLTRNEARLLEELNPLPGLDDPLTPLNLGTAADRAAAAQKVAVGVKALIARKMNGSTPMIEDAELEAEVARALISGSGPRLTGLLSHLEG